MDDEKIYCSNCFVETIDEDMCADCLATWNLDEMDFLRN